MALDRGKSPLFLCCPKREDEAERADVSGVNDCGQEFEDLWYHLLML